MKTTEEIQVKIQELDGLLKDLESDLEETLEDEEIEEGTAEAEEYETEFASKKEAIEKQIEILKWVSE